MYLGKAIEGQHETNEVTGESQRTSRESGRKGTVRCERNLLFAFIWYFSYMWVIMALLWLMGRVNIDFNSYLTKIWNQTTYQLDDTTTQIA